MMQKNGISRETWKVRTWARLGKIQIAKTFGTGGGTVQRVLT